MHRANTAPLNTTSRTQLVDTAAARVEHLRHIGQFNVWERESYCDTFQICLPYRGLFVWHVGEDEVVGDPNQVVFVRADEGYRMSSPLPAGYGEVVIAPSLDTLAELAHVDGRPLSRHPLFTRRACRAEPRLQALRAHVLRWATDASAGLVDELDAEEMILTVMRAALDTQEPQVAMASATSARLIRRAKEFLADELSGRILLADIGRAVGASPTYLTHLFRRVEGASLHQYLTQLRLARALVELPHSDDLTALALDVGFSSHSHFSAAFRRTFGCTPSQFRAAPRPTRTTERAPALTM